MKLILPAFLWTFLFSIQSGVWAEDISIANYITDPGFEAPHDANAQINAPDIKELNGWSAAPLHGNFWTSVSYVNAGGKSLGDKRDAIKPAEGKSYLRMYTEKSSNWLALRTPTFPLKDDTTYVLSFKVATDTQPAMARVDVGLRDAKGTYHGLKSYELKDLGHEWSTIVYRFHYIGPDQVGALQITGRREDAGTTGVLNLDDFKTPTGEEVSLTPTEL